MELVGCGHEDVERRVEFRWRVGSEAVVPKGSTINLWYLSIRVSFYPQYSALPWYGSYELMTRGSKTRLKVPVP